MTDVLAERVSYKLRTVSRAARTAECELPATSRLYFASACEGAGQYKTFLLTATALLQLCSRQLHVADTSAEPASSVKTLLSEVRAAGLDPGQVAGQSLQDGYGPDVCRLLDQLAEAALQQQSTALETPTHSQQQPVIQAAPSALYEVSNDPTIDVAADKEAAARAWQQEARELEAQGLLSLPPTAGLQSWQANLAAMRAQAEQLHALGALAQQLLSNLELEVSEDLRQLAAQQKRLNVQFQPQLAELQAQQQGLEGLQQAEAAQREAVAQAQDVLQHLSQELRQKKKQLHAAADEAGSRQALQQVQGAVARLEGELADMGVQLGLLQHQALRSQPVHSALPAVAI